jgi:hypothetical protein
MGNLRPAIAMKPGTARGKDFRSARSPLLSSRGAARHGASYRHLPLLHAGGSEFGVQAVRAAAPTTAASNFSLTLDRLNYQFSRKVLRI